MNREIIVDAFAGRGGASTGIELAIGRSVDIAINHDPDAIIVHKTNHPNTLHITEYIFTVDLRKYLKKGQRVKLLWAQNKPPAGKERDTQGYDIKVISVTPGKTLNFKGVTQIVRDKDWIHIMSGEDKIGMLIPENVTAIVPMEG